MNFLSKEKIRLPKVRRFISIVELRGLSSVGRALAWHARGRGFESHRLHFGEEYIVCELVLR